MRMGADGCGWGEGGGMEGARMRGEAGEERGRGARGGRDVRGAGANRKVCEAGRGVWEAAARGEGGRREKNGHIA